MIISIRKLAFTLIVVSVSTGSVLAQRGLIPAKFLKILPGVSTRTDVDKKYGKAASKDTMVDYFEADFVVVVTYSDRGCEPSRDIPWAMPKDVVEEVSYNVRDENILRLKESDPRPFEIYE